MALQLDWQTEDDIKNCSFARVLVTGDRKAGKTTRVLTTAPGPIAVLNADGDGATQPAVRHGAKFRSLNVTTPDLWTAGVKAACDMAAKDEIRTIVVDTITLLVNVNLALHYGRIYDGYDIWSATYKNFMDGMMMLKNANAHVFYLAHYDMDSGLLTLDGKLKKDVPALVNDIVHLDFKPGRKMKVGDDVVALDRAFQIGPSANGLSGGRSSEENKLIPADVGILFEELGIVP